MATVYIRGRFARYVKYFCDPKTDGMCKLFAMNYAQMYMFASLYGCVNDCRCVYNPMDDEPTDVDLSPIEVKEDTFKAGWMPEYRRLILLNEHITTRDNGAKIDSTFRYDFKDCDDQRKNNAIIEEYALGGLDKLYRIFKNCTTKEDYVITFNEVLTNLIKQINN